MRKWVIWFSTTGRFFFGLDPEELSKTCLKPVTFRTAKDAERLIEEYPFLEIAGAQPKEVYMN